MGDTFLERPAGGSELRQDGLQREMLAGGGVGSTSSLVMVRIYSTVLSFMFIVLNTVPGHSRCASEESIRTFSSNAWGGERWDEMGRLRSGHGGLGSLLS